MSKKYYIHIIGYAYTRYLKKPFFDSSDFLPRSAVGLDTQWASICGMTSRSHVYLFRASRLIFGPLPDLEQPAPKYNRFVQNKYTSDIDFKSFCMFLMVV